MRTSQYSHTPDRACRMLDEYKRMAPDHPEHDRKRAAVIEELVPFAVRQARRFANTSESLDDLIQVATVGLIGAVDRYEPGRGASFYSFALPTVRGELKRHFRDRTWSVHPTRRVQELRLQIQSVSEPLTQTLGHPPTPSELAAWLDVGLGDILNTLAAWQNYHARSLNVPLRHGEDSAELGDQIGGPDPVLERAADRVSLPDAFDQLNERSRQIVVLHYFHNLKQADIAQRLGISQMHVSRLLAAALAQMRAFLNGDPPGAAIRPRARGRVRKAASTPETHAAAA